MDKPTCSMPDCGKPILCKRLCRNHYAKSLRERDLEAARAKQRAYRRANGDRINAAARQRRQEDGDAVRATERARYHRNPGARRDQALQRLFGIDRATYDAILAAQGGVCAICGCEPGSQQKPFAVDHDHACCPERGRSCGQCVRGILCARCNVGLGMFQDNERALMAALDYLNQPPATGVAP